MYYANLICTRLCFIRFMFVHPSPDKNKDKEEDDKYYLTLLINSANLDIGRVKEVGSLGLDK